MPSRDEMIKALQQQDESIVPSGQPSREEMIRALQATDSQKNPSQFASGVRQLAQGLSGNFSDELAGATEAAGRAIGLEGVGGPMKDIHWSKQGPKIDWASLKAAYKEGRDKERDTLAKDQKTNPRISGTANIVGMIASPVNKLNPTAAGMAFGAGTSDAEDLGGMAKDTAVGGVFGYGAGKVADRVAPVLEGAVSKIGNKTKEAAEMLMARGLGAERATVRQLGKDRVRAAGRQALDEGTAPIFASTDDMIARNSAVKEKGGEMMNKAYAAIDDAGASTFNPLEVASKVDDQLAPQFRTPINKGETNQLENTLESILARGEKNISLKEAQALKQEIGSVAFPGGRRPLDPTPKQQMAMDAYKIVNQSIDDAVSKGGDLIESAGLTDVLSRGKELYGNAKTADKLLRNKQAREEGNKLFGLTDTIAGAGAVGYGGTTGDWKTAGGIMLAKKGLEKYGTKAAAIGLDKITKRLSQSPVLASLMEKSPQAFNAIAQKIEQRVSPSFPKAADKKDPVPSEGGTVVDNVSMGEVKGEAKWALNGLNKLIDHDESGLLNDPEVIEKLISSPQGKKLLISASDLKPGSKAMQQLYAKIQDKEKR